MARTESTMLELGTTAPRFTLPDVDGGTVSIDDFADAPALLVMFICNHCPFVHHVLDEILMIVNDYRVMGIGVMAISSNDAVQYPQDAPDKMREFAFRNRIDFPYLYDESQDVARAFEAAPVGQPPGADAGADQTAAPEGPSAPPGDDEDDDG